MTLRVGSLCTGYGGIEQALRLLFPVELVFVSDIGDSPSAVLKHRYPNVPNLGDVNSVDWYAQSGIDILTAGYPCVGFSNAGKRKGHDDPRNAWPGVLRAVRYLRPRLLILENVAAHVNRGWAEVVGALAEVGYDTRWTCLRASDVGAPHRRDRLFAVAIPNHGGWEWWSRHLAEAGGRDEPANRSDPASHTYGGGLSRIAERDVRPEAGQSAPCGDHAVRCGQALADTHDSGRQGPEPAAGRDVPAWGVAPDAEGERRGEGRSEPAGLVGGPDVAQCGDAAAPDADSCGCRGDESDARQRPLERVAADGHRSCGDGTPLADTSGGGDPDEPLGSDAEGLPVGAVARPGDRARARGASEGVHELGRDAGVVAWGPYEPAVRRWESVIGRPAPFPTVAGQRGGVALNPQLPEWMMGLPLGWVTEVPGLSRAKQLAVIGGGVVPLQGAAAIGSLLEVA